MRLAEFIRKNTAAISAEWEKFARTLLPEEEFSVAVLRNGIEELLEEIANNMDEPQSVNQQKQKSRGNTSRNEMEDVAEAHVDERIKMGLSSRQLISEFRALRASVISLWRKNRETVSLSDMDDLTRFHEAVDEAITEAEGRYSKKTDQSRELFLGILGHDLRNPLAAISGSAELILRAPRHERNADLAAQILVSTGRISHMITDLIELTRLRLGQGIAITPVRTNIRDLCVQAIEEMHSVHPGRVFRLEAESDLAGEWDEAKLNQVLSNLIGNAVQHGAPDSEIIVTAKKTGSGVEIKVHNEGAPIPQRLMPRLFDRFVQNRTSATGGKPGSMGLGLYIAKEIVMAHGGSIVARSSEEEGTTFSVSVPWTPPHAKLSEMRLH